MKAGNGDDEKEAKAMIDDLLLSPILKDVLCKAPNFEIKDGNPPSSIVARINRAELGDYDSLVLASLLVFQFKGQVIVSDFGFYARPFYTSLIRQNRLAVGVNCLAELPKDLQQMCLLMEEKVGFQCTYDDAVTLAQYEGVMPHTDGHDTVVKRYMGLL